MFFLFQFLSLLPKKKHTKSNALKRQTRTHHATHSLTNTPIHTLVVVQNTIISLKRQRALVVKR